MIEQTKSTGRTVVGKVVSNKMDKTIKVEVERKVKHPLYHKYMRRSSKMSVHDSENTCMIGDVVQIQQSRPLSKTKSWILVKILERADKGSVG